MKKESILRIIIDGQMSYNLSPAGVPEDPEDNSPCLTFRIPRNGISETIPEKARILFITPGKKERAGFVEEIRADAGNVFLSCQFHSREEI
jgi:hypothetical protein